MFQVWGFGVLRGASLIIPHCSNSCLFAVTCPSALQSGRFFQSLVWLIGEIRFGDRRREGPSRILSGERDLTNEEDDGDQLEKDRMDVGNDVHLDKEVELRCGFHG